MNKIAAVESEAGAVRREPIQKRSRERVERILGCASTLDREERQRCHAHERRGRDGGDFDRLAVSILSRQGRDHPHAGGPLQCGRARSALRRVWQDVQDREGLRRAFGELIDVYYAMFLAEPVMRDIWSGTQADKALRDIDLADSRLNGAVLAAARERVDPKADRAELETSSFLIMQLGEATMRLAISVERKEGDVLVEQYKRMVLREMMEGDSHDQGHDRHLRRNFPQWRDAGRDHPGDLSCARRGAGARASIRGGRGRGMRCCACSTGRWSRRTAIR